MRRHSRGLAEGTRKVADGEAALSRQPLEWKIFKSRSAAMLLAAD